MSLLILLKKILFKFPPTRRWLMKRTQRQLQDAANTWAESLFKPTSTEKPTQDINPTDHTPGV